MTGEIPRTVQTSRVRRFFWVGEGLPRRSTPEVYPGGLPRRSTPEVHAGPRMIPLRFLRSTPVQEPGIGLPPSTGVGLRDGCGAEPLRGKRSRRREENLREDGTNSGVWA